MSFIFKPFELDPSLCELRQSGRHIHVQPKVFRLLLMLIQHRHRVVTLSELRDNLWPEQVVGPTSLARAVCAARRVLGQMASAQNPICTIRGQGYRFVCPVQEHGAIEIEYPAIEEPLIVAVSLQCRALLASAALMEGPFSIETLAAANELSRRRVIVLLDEALSAGYVQASSETGTYQFATFARQHAILRGLPASELRTIRQAIRSVPGRT